MLDLTAFWAGPLIGHACAILGAEVIHVESTKQPDGIRCNTTRTMDEPRWWEWCPMFQGSNTNKLDLAVELDTERGRELFLDLVAVSDVVIDNFSPRVLDQLELDQDVLLARNPSVIVLRAPGYGVDGAWRERLAYAPTIEAQAGIAWTTGFPDRGPEPPSGIADALGGAHATFALLLALEHRAARDAACSSSARWWAASLNVAAQQVIEFSAYGRLLERLGNRSSTCVPQGVYRTADVDADGTQDRWVAVAVADDEQWRAFAALLGVEVERRGDQDALDALIAGWCATPRDRRHRAHPLGRRHSRARRSCAPTSTTGSLRWWPAGCSSGSTIRSPASADFIGAPFRLANGPSCAPPRALAPARRAQPRRAHPHPRADRRRRRRPGGGRRDRRRRRRGSPALSRPALNDGLALPRSSFQAPAMEPAGVAVVTGASRGIGRGIAVDLARAGFDVIATMRDPKAGEDLVDEVGEASGSITVQRLDVDDPPSIELPSDLRVLVNNAGIERDYLPVEHVPMDQWRDVFETNVFGLVEVTERAIPVLRANGGGVICNVTSSSILVPVPFYAVYRASKAAVSALDDTLRVELAPFGIRVVEIMPGPVESDMLYDSDRMSEAAEHEEYRAMAEAVYEGRKADPRPVHAGARGRRRDPRRDPRRRRPDAARL